MSFPLAWPKHHPNEIDYLPFPGEGPTNQGNQNPRKSNLCLAIFCYVFLGRVLFFSWFGLEVGLMMEFLPNFFAKNSLFGLPPNVETTLKTKTAVTNLQCPSTWKLRQKKKTSQLPILFKKNGGKWGKWCTFPSKKKKQKNNRQSICPVFTHQKPKRLRKKRVAPGSPWRASKSGWVMQSDDDLRNHFWKSDTF